jgi:quinol monooxygenase YgiN
MPATLHVVERFVTKSGKEETVKAALTALVAPARREIGCYQYDLLVDSSDIRQLCVVERWGDVRAFDRYLETAQVKSTLEQIEGLLDSPPEIRRYTLV